MRYVGRLKRRRVHQHFSHELNDFVESMKCEQALTDNTINSRRIRAAVFLRWYSTKHRRFCRITLRDLDAYFSYCARKWNPVTLASDSSSLRAFFHHAERRGWCSPGIANGIKSPPIRHNSEALGPKWSEVSELLRATNGAGPADLRAKALLLLTAMYGLRSSEVIRLRLDDFDWQHNEFTVLRSKRGGLQQFPLQREVSKAVLEYIDGGRFQCSSPNVFVTLRVPYRAITTHTLSCIVSRRMKALGINPKHKGPQSLRHACATHLLSKGTSLREIADFLGHHDCETVGVYAKADLDYLRQISVLDVAKAL